MKGKRKHHPASRGSLDPVIFVFVVHFFFFFLHYLFFSINSKQTTAAELQDGAAAALFAPCTGVKKKNNVVFIPEPDF